MKKYPFILIDRGDMTRLRHFPTAVRMADAVYPKSGPKIVDQYIFIRDEKTVCDVSELATLTALPEDVHSRLVKILS